jgi:hypothetical protein
MAVRADPRLRGVRFGEQIEVTAWYVLAEALSNVVKHAEASEVEVSLSQEDGRLGLVIRDDGCGFDLDRPRGLGLTGLSDRLGTVGGSLTINSSAGLGTSVCVHIPVDQDQEEEPEPGPEQVPSGSARMPEPLRIVMADDNYLVREGATWCGRARDGGRVVASGTRMGSSATHPFVVQRIHRSALAFTESSREPTRRRRQACTQGATRSSDTDDQGLASQFVMGSAEPPVNPQVRDMGVRLGLRRPADFRNAGRHGMAGSAGPITQRRAW